MFLNIKYKDPLILNTFVIKYTKHTDNSIDKVLKKYFQNQKTWKNKIISSLFKIII